MLEKLKSLVLQMDGTNAAPRVEQEAAAVAGEGGSEMIAFREIERMCSEIVSGQVYNLVQAFHGSAYDRRHTRRRLRRTVSNDMYQLLQTRRGEPIAEPPSPSPANQVPQLMDVETRPTFTTLPWPATTTSSTQTEERGPQEREGVTPSSVTQGSQTEEVLVLSSEDQDSLLGDVDDPLPELYF